MTHPLSLSSPQSVYPLYPACSGSPSAMRRSHLKRGKPIKRGGRVKFRSERRIKEDRVRYGGVRAVVVERSGGWCEYPGCHLPATDMHEHLPAGRGGSRTDPSNIKHFCRKHHDLAHATNDLKSGHQPITPSPHGVAFEVKEEA